MISVVFSRWVRGAARCRAVVVLAMSTGVFTGCMVPPANDAARTGPFYKPSNFTGDAQLPANVRRVVLLPIAGGAVATSESVTALDAVFTTALQKQNRFEIVPLSRTDCLLRFQAEEFPSVGVLPANFISRLKREYAADAVMFVDLTVYKPYRPLVLGVRAKLATLEDNVRLIWTFDNVYSASDAAVANSARAHFIDSDRGGIPADLTPAVLQSPGQFAAYVASDMFSTLPAVYAPAAPVKAKQAAEVAPVR